MRKRKPHEAMFAIHHVYDQVTWYQPYQLSLLIQLRTSTQVQRLIRMEGEALPDAHVANSSSRKTLFVFLIFVQLTPQKASLKTKKVPYISLGTSS